MLPKSQFLRYIVLFYGNLGIQLFPVENFFGYFNLLQNCLIQFLIRYIIFLSPLFNGTSFIEFIKQTKPLFGLFFEAVLTNLLPPASFIILIHYFLYGRRIITVLDHSLLRWPFKGRGKQCFIGTFLGSIFTLACISSGNFFAITSYKNELSLFEYLISIFSFYVITCLSFFHFFTIHYLLHSTICNLIQIQLKLTRKCTKNEENTLIHQFIQLATLNRQVYSLVAIQVIVAFPVAVINSVASVYLFTFFVPLWYLLLFPAFNLSYAFYIVSLNLKVQLLSSKILQTLKGRARAEESRSLRRRIPQWHNGRLVASSSTSWLVRRFELDLYLEYFQFSVLSLAHIDRPFLLGTVLVALNYAIFIYQT